MARAETANRRMAGRARGAADRPSALRLLLVRHRRVLRLAGLAGLGLVAAIILVMQFRPIGSSESLNSSYDRLGPLLGMRLQTVTVEGRSNTPESMLREILPNPETGVYLFGFSVKKIQEQIKTLPWVETVVVERRLPGALFVELHEKRPFAIWQHNGRFQLIDRDGNVVTNENLSGFASLPLVVGEGAPAGAQALLDEVARYPALQDHTEAAVRVGGRRWNLRLKNGADVELPEGAEPAALKRLMELQATDSLLDRHLKVIDMRLADRLVIRPAADSVPTQDAGPGAAKGPVQGVAKASAPGSKIVGKNPTRSPAKTPGVSPTQNPTNDSAE